MSKRSVPILIGLMSLALLGIIVIQFLWINNTIDEKQKVIDNNVKLAIENVEQRLNDHRAMTFISDSLLNDFSFEEIITFGDTSIIREEKSADGTGKMEIKVMTGLNEEEEEIVTHTIQNGDEHTEIIIQNESNRIIRIDSTEDEMTFTHKVDELGQVESLINRMRIEVHGDLDDMRLDSTHVSHLILDELAANELGELTDWGIFDEKELSFKIAPKNPSEIDYQIQLFTTDIMNPGRYDLYLKLNSETAIWSQIWGMIILSLLFIVIITAVFAYSIKLVVKHKKISQIKSDFINNMTHEFKTPLASISLAADSLLHPNTKADRETLERYVKIIQSEKSKLNNQVERILEVASLKQDSLDIPISGQNLSQLIVNSIEQLTLLIEKSKAQIKIEAPDSVLVKANNFHLTHVITNLIENGIKYSVDQPLIEIELKEQQGEVILTIKDQGIGMDPHQIKKAFDNFYRAQTGNIHNTKGFGLGLSYSKLVVEKMGGTISLESKKNLGTTVIIKLQLA